MIKLKLKHQGQTLRLPPLSKKLLLALMGRDKLFYADAVEILWPHPDDQPDFWRDNIHVHIASVRNELKRVNSNLSIVVTKGQWVELI